MPLLSPEPRNRPRLLLRFLVSVLASVFVVSIGIVYYSTSVANDRLLGFGPLVEIVLFAPLIGVPIGAVVGICVCIPHLGNGSNGGGSSTKK
jgi:hypothetical protein